MAMSWEWQAMRSGKKESIIYMKDFPSVSAIDCKLMTVELQSSTYFAVFVEITNFPCSYLFTI